MKNKSALRTKKMLYPIFLTAVMMILPSGLALAAELKIIKLNEPDKKRWQVLIFSFDRTLNLANG